MMFCLCKQDKFLAVSFARPYNVAMQKIIKSAPYLQEALHKCFRRIDEHCFIQDEAMLSRLEEDGLVYVLVDNKRVYGYIVLSRNCRLLYEDYEDDAYTSMLDELGIYEDDKAAIIGFGVDPAVPYEPYLKLLMDFAKSKYDHATLLMRFVGSPSKQMIESLKKQHFSFYQDYGCYKYRKDGLSSRGW